MGSKDTQVQCKEKEKFHRAAEFKIGLIQKVLPNATAVSGLVKLKTIPASYL